MPAGLERLDIDGNRHHAMILARMVVPVAGPAR